MRAGDRRPATELPEHLDVVTRSQPLGDDRSHTVDAAIAEEPLVEVLDDIGQVDVMRLVDEGGGLLSSGGAHTKELHDGPFRERGRSD